ncbi:hypothetical protein MMC26_002222 [Xylographa opegraphella]|nr:hypothetical protein [Xylographa opegraphella]
MQTIWSRAIQTKSTCRCPSCLTTPFAVARRPNTVAASRSLRYGDIATFFYSSVLATAAIADAERKDARRKKLDTSIAEAVEELKALELEQQTRLQNLHNAQREIRLFERQYEGQIQSLREAVGRTHGAQQDKFLEKTLKSLEANKLSSLSALDAAGESLSDTGGALGTTDVTTEIPNHGDKIITLASKHEDNSVVAPSEVSRRVKGIPEESVTKNTTQDLDEGSPPRMTSLAESASESVLYEDSSMDFTKSRQSTYVWSFQSWLGPIPDFKISVMSTSIAKLIYRLLLMSLDGAGPEGLVLNVGGTPWILSPQHRPELHMRIMEMTERLRTLKKASVDINSITPLPFPQYSNHAGHRTSTDFLHKALRNSLAETSSIYELLPKICYEFLVSNTPPSIRTFNMLIVRLCYLQHYGVASAIIDALFECKLRHNEITTAAILRFYDYTKNFDGFRGYVAMMNAEGDRGLITLSSVPQITRANKNHFVNHTESRSRKHSILSHKGHPRRETRYIEKAPRNRDTYMALISGWLSFSDLRSALTEYVTMIRSGWEPDHVILTTLLSYCALKKDFDWGFEVWREIVETHERPDAAAYYWMLHLCAQVNGSKMFDTVLQHGADRGIIPADIHVEAFSVPVDHLEGENRLLQMIQEHIRIPGLDPLTQNQKATPKAVDGIGSFLSDALEHTDTNQLTRARKHVANLDTPIFNSLTDSKVEPKPLVIRTWSQAESAQQGLSLAPELAARRSVGSAQMSHIPDENSPSDELFQLSELSAPRDRAIIRAESVANKDALQESRTAGPAPNEVENGIDQKNHSPAEPWSSPSVSVAVVPGTSGQKLSDMCVSDVNVELPESKKTMVSGNAMSHGQASFTMACAATWDMPEESRVTLASQADETVTATSRLKHLHSEQTAVSLVKDKELQPAKPTAVLSKAKHELPKEIQISLGQNDKTQAIVPSIAIPSKDELSIANSSQSLQLDIPCVGHNVTHFVLNISHETQVSTVA